MTHTTDQNIILNVLVKLGLNLGFCLVIKFP